MFSEKLSQRFSCIHTVGDREGVLPFRVPEQTLGQMVKAKRDQVRENRDRRPPIDGIDDHVTSWACELRKCRYGSLRISQMLGDHSQGYHVERALRPIGLDGRSNTLMYMVVLIEGTVRIKSDQQAATLG